MNYQNAIRLAIYDIIDEYPNYLKAEYKTEDLQKLTDLALLYLRCGSLGFEYYFEDNAVACADAYREMQKMSVPKNEIKIEKLPVSIGTYSAPGNISEGDTYVVYGTITAEENIASVTIEIIGANGYILESADVNSTQFDVHSMDKRIAASDGARSLFFCDWKYYKPEYFTGSFCTDIK